MDQVEQAAAKRLGEPVEAATLMMPVGGWSGGGLWELGKRLFRRSRGEAPPTVRLDSHNALVVTATRVACFSATFARGEGMVLGDELAEFSRGSLDLESKRMEANVYPSNPAGTVDASSKRIHRVELRSGDELLRGDIADDGRGREVLKVLRDG